MTKRTNSIDKHIGMRVRRTRMFRDLSQEQFAAALGVPLLQVKKFESGFERIGASQLADICRVLKVRPSFFFTDIKGAGEAGPHAAGRETGDAAESAAEDRPDLSVRIAALAGDEKLRTSPIFALLRKLEAELRARRALSAPGGQRPVRRDAN